MACPRRAFPVLVALCIVAPDARPSEPSADARFAAAKQALQHKRFDAAVGLFRELHTQAKPGPERWFARLGMALAFQLKQDTERAVFHFRGFLDESAKHPTAGTGTWPAKRDQAKATIGELVDSLLETRAEVFVTSSPPGATVRVPGVALPRPDDGTPRYLYLPSGAQTLKVRSAGYRSETVPLDLSVGTRKTMHLSLARLDVPRAPPPKTLPAPDRTLSLAGWSLLGTGIAAALVGGILTGLVAEDISALNAISTSKNISRTDEYWTLAGRVEPRMHASWAMYALGGAAAATGILLLVLDALDSDSAAPSVQVAPNGPGFTVGGRF